MRIRDAQCDYPGGIIGLKLEGGRPAAFSFLRSLRIVRNAVSLVGVETLACHPRSTTHSEMSEDVLDRAGKSTRWGKQTVILPGGRGHVDIPIAYNDAPGVWTVRVIELFTGQTAKATWLLR